MVPTSSTRPGLTTRPPRPGEREGVEYHFVTNAAFDALVREDRLLEWADVHGHRYGTAFAEYETAKREGKDLLLDIDVQGARQVRTRGLETIGIFVLPPSFEVLEQRLRGRSKDSEAAMQRRLQTAREEVAAYAEYDYVVVNDEFESCVERLRAIVAAERARLDVVRGAAEAIVATFTRKDQSRRE